MIKVLCSYPDNRNWRTHSEGMIWSIQQETSYNGKGKMVMWYSGLVFVIALGESIIEVWRSGVEY